jgi:CDP-paratose 2-epimerase
MTARTLKSTDSAAPVLITGGAGFIGTNLAHRLLTQGNRVRVFDSLAREGVTENLHWLRTTHRDRLEIVIGDVRDPPALDAALRDVRHVFHFAAQVAVTTSLTDPKADFSTNAAGTLNLLEAARAQSTPPAVTYASTNKVYGALADLGVHAYGTRYVPADSRVRLRGIDESRPLEFHSPYGCSKGSAEQYVLDYARTFGMRNTVLRMSCIYGPHQHGNADQGWVAHFLRTARRGDPLTVYGDGLQVRDVLFIDDFVNALLRALEHPEKLAAQAFNMGGGVENTVSLLELIDMIEEIYGRALEVQYEEWRDADQKYYVSDITRFAAATGWRPRVRVESGVRALAAWLGQNPRDAHHDLTAPLESRETHVLGQGVAP